MKYTLNIFKQYRRNPQGFAYLQNIVMEYCPYIKPCIKSAIHYVSSSLFSEKVRLKNASHFPLVLAIYPLGVLLNLYIRIKTK